ncbi:MAG: hypothetical protein LQ350_008573, partial [Teloschistes chrysophthalmus]
SGGAVIVAAADNCREVADAPSFDREAVAEAESEVAAPIAPSEDEPLDRARLLMELMLAKVVLGDELTELSLPPAEPPTLEDPVMVAPKPDGVLDGTAEEEMAKESLSDELESELEDELLKTELVGEESLDSESKEELRESVLLSEELPPEELLAGELLDERILERLEEKELLMELLTDIDEDDNGFKREILLERLIAGSSCRL